MAIRPGRPGYKYLVSACLAGIACTCDATSNLKPAIRALAESKKALPVCPEVLGGLGIPREESEITGGDDRAVLNKRAKVLTASGRDVSSNYIRGANKIIRLAGKYGILKAILKSKSPACGSGFIYDGTFTHTLKKGDGVLTALLKPKGIRIYTEKSKNY